MTPDLNDRFAASDDVVAREVGGETVLLNLESGLYFGLDAVGARAWSKLSDGSTSVADLVDLIEAEFDAPRDRIAKDMAELLEQMQSHGLVIEAESAIG